MGTGERTTETEERTEPVAFGVDKRPTTEIPVGETRVVSEGKNGEDKIIVEQDYINGKPYGTPREKRVHITPPVNQVVEYGVEKDAPIEPENPAETPNENPDNNNPENPDVNVDNPSTNNPSDKMDQELPNPDKPLETDKDKHDVDGGTVNVDKGGKITESDIKDAVKVKDYPKDKGEPLVIIRDKKQIPDTTKTGSYGVSVTVKFPDGSTTESVVKVNVTEKTDKDVDKDDKDNKDKASDDNKDNTVATNKTDNNDKNNTPNDTTTTKSSENKTNNKTSRVIDGNNVAAKVYRESSLVNDKGVIEGDTRSMMKSVSSSKAIEMNDDYDVFKGEDFKQPEQEVTNNTNENVLPETGSSSNDTAKTATFLSLISGLGLLFVGKRRKQDSK